MSFRLSQYNTHRIGIVLDGLSYPERIFTAQPDFLRQCKMFITQDEIDRFFLNESVESRLSVYSHFCYPHTPDENQKFIKSQFGEYSGGAHDGYDYTKTQKGLTYQREYARKRYDEVRLTIPKVIKEYEQLIAQKRFPGENAISQIPQYELNRLARVVYFGFYDAPDEISRPYPKHADYYAAIPAIEAQLQDKEKTAEILRTLSSWLDNMDESNRCFNSCLKAKNQLSAYVNGTFSLFNHRHDDLQQNRPASSTIPNQSVLSIAQHDSMIPTYKVGDTVYLDDKPFEITNIGDFDVQLRDPSLLYPVFRAESRQRFEKMLEQDERNNVYHDEVVSKPMQFIAHFYVVDDLQVQDQLTVTEYVSLEDALKAYQALPNTQMKSLGIQNTNRLPGSLDFIQCIDGKDTLIHDYMQISGWKNPEINAVVHRIEKVLEESKSEIFASYEQENPTGGLDDTPGKESHETPVAIQIDGEWQTFPNVASAEKAAYEESKVEIRRNAQNFHITDDALGVGGPKAKYQANINAIKLLKYLEADGRQALPEQQEVLSRYVGWGGLPDAFDPDKPAWAAEYTELKGLLTDEEYAAARASTLNAHYTSPTVIKAIYEAVGNMGFKAGNILEPSMGVGNFFGMLPEEMQSSRLFGIELDSITGRIAKQLYPKADITVAGFETTNRPNFYDLAIGNVPFGQYQVNDPSFNKLHFNIHNYFFAKALDQVRPGGIVAFVTTRYTMDAKDSTVRKYLAERADLLGAIRLPNNAFKENAGTEVVSDIIFLQKRDDPIVTEPDWVHLGVDDHGYAINRYFLDNPDMVLGQNAEHSTAHGMDYTVIPDNLTSLADQLHAAVGHIHGSYDSLAHVDLDAATADTVIPADPNVKNFSYTIKNDTVYYRENSIMSVPDFKKKGKHVFDRIRALIPLRNCVQELLDMQANGYPTDEELASKQDELDTLYDSFVAKYGRITEKANEVAFSNDDSYFLLCSLEVLDDNRNFVAKSPFFTERTIRPSEVIDHVDTPAEALELSMAERGKIDLPYMANLLNRDDYAEITKELQGAIFRDPEIPNPENSPTVGWVIADEYLSGNVRHKLRAAQAAAAQQPEFKANVSALTEVQPKDLDASEIEARLGATWIPLEYISQFMHETFNTSDSNKERFPVRYSPITNEWRIEHCGSNMSSDVVATVKYGTSRINAYEILERTLNLKDVLVYDYFENPDGSKKAVLNTKATTLAQEKQRLIREAFKDWIWKDPDRRVDLVHRYNEEMNNLRNREYDGSHLRFVGMSSSITLKEHQRNAIAHILYGGNTLLAHSVGAGKSATRS